MRLLDVVEVLVPTQYIYVIDDNGDETFYGVVGDIPMKYTRVRVKKMMTEENTPKKENGANNMDYKLDLKKGDYITQTQRKLFSYALKWCLENGETSCRANRTYFNFDFEKLEVNINGIGYGNNNTYKMRRC